LQKSLQPSNHCDLKIDYFHMWFPCQRDLRTFAAQPIWRKLNSICFISQIKDLMQGKFFQRCTHLLYYSVLSLGGNVNTRRMSKPDMRSIFHINNQWNILIIRNYYMNYQNYQNSMLLTSSDTERTLRHLFLFINSTQRELVLICTQSIRNCN